MKALVKEITLKLSCEDKYDFFKCMTGMISYRNKQYSIFSYGYVAYLGWAAMKEEESCAGNISKRASGTLLRISGHTKLN